MTKTARHDDRKYDLSDRTTKFAKATIDFLKSIPKNSINNPLISQLVRSASSISANYMEADVAESKRDFVHKIAICRKEAKESEHWFDLLAHANPSCKTVAEKLAREAHELLLIFSSIIHNANK